MDSEGVCSVMMGVPLERVGVGVGGWVANFDQTSPDSSS